MGVLHVLKYVLDNITLCCGYSKESSHMVWLDNKRDIVRKRAVYPVLSGPLQFREAYFARPWHNLPTPSNRKYNLAVLRETNIVDSA